MSEAGLGPRWGCRSGLGREAEKVLGWGWHPMRLNAGILQPVITMAIEMMRKRWLGFHLKFCIGRNFLAGSVISSGLAITDKDRGWA
jgi:hypothetical protein